MAALIAIRSSNRLFAGLSRSISIVPSASSRFISTSATKATTLTSTSTPSSSSNASPDSPYSKPFFEKNKLLNRPLSPHLTIYKPQLTSVLSIAHRITGSGLAIGISAVAITAMVSPHDFAYYVDLVKSWDLHPIVTLSAKYILAWPVVYHTINGVRHMIWDSGRALRLPQTYLGGYIVVALSLVATSLLTYL